MNINKMFGKGLNLEVQDNLDEQQLLQIIEARVVELLQTNPELLMSYLYRLDVLEKDINTMLQCGSDQIASGFARLIYERQMVRWRTKQAIKVDPIEGGWE